MAYRDWRDGKELMVVLLLAMYQFPDLPRLEVDQMASRVSIWMVDAGVTLGTDRSEYGRDSACRCIEQLVVIVVS